MTKRDFVELALIAIMPPVLMALVEFNPAAVVDYKLWAGSVVGAMIRAFGQFGLIVLRERAKA